MMENPKKAMALITGAGVRVGRAIALRLAARGYTIGLHWHHSEEPARQTAQAIEQIGAAVVPLQADLREPKQIEAMFSQIAAGPYRLAVLVNSAAVMQAGDLMEMSVEDWDATLTLNLRAPWLCARAAARLMGDQGGVIIQISDTGARKAWTGYPAYVVSKSALETLTRLLARRLGPHIRVNAIAPGLILPAAGMDENEWQRLAQKTALQRPGNPEDVARAVEFLVENLYITGEVLAVDGGYSLT